MREIPANQLDPRIKAVWRINDGFWISLIALGVLLPFILVEIFDPMDWVWPVLITGLALYAACLVLFIGILPQIRYVRWRYELTPDYLDIAKGIIWRKRYVIPFIRVQNTDTRQGPLLRAVHLSSVTVATAAGEHVIPGLGIEEADRLRDRAAELARIAREDV